ncbi:MAG: SAM-dependent methyltransferase [Akkermansiaceae bacterium]
MPDSESSTPAQAEKRAAGYANNAPPATPALGGILRDRIARDGALSFVDFMACALYEPGLGYYARSARQVGREGDFFTSVSVGPLFGELLARRFLREWQEAGAPRRWRIIECGAHDGRLAADLLGAMQRLDAHAFAALEYAIPEPLPLLQAAQRGTLENFASTVRHIARLDELATEPPLPGVAFGNELLDALPFYVIEFTSGGWRECRVGLAPDGSFMWENHHAITDPPLKQAVAALGDHFPEGYRSEVRTNFHELLTALTRCLSSGLLVWPDYGFARPEYYHPDRRQGTLRTFSRHRAAENPLATPGEIDITAHVDFTAVAEAALSLGCQPGSFRSQGSWLTEIGRDWLLSLEDQPPPAALREFQTLTHPGHLGGSFHVLELHWNQPEKHPAPADLHRLALLGSPSPRVNARCTPCF